MYGRSSVLREKKERKHISELKSSFDNLFDQRFISGSIELIFGQQLDNVVILIVACLFSRSKQAPKGKSQQTPKIRGRGGGGEAEKCRGFSIGINGDDEMKPGAAVDLRNANIDMFKGSMRLAVDKWGGVEVTDPADFAVKEDNNLYVNTGNKISWGKLQLSTRA
ncbi:hypothetical protein V6N12_062897 [Hibiscus sabdariffa]|uniref:Single-stranded DNA binding protein Ssb-like OB fold domain-containing protein n=1 Tax=Hibiscus sabdariffa TaxID=183260 RepID=A0ABR2FA61_9ROSI